MRNLCSRCGADLAMVGRSHRCIPRSRGGGEVIEQPRKAGNKAGSIPAEAGTSTAARLVRGIEGETPRRSHAGVVPGPRDKRSRDADVTVLAGTTRDAKPIGRSDEAKARKSEAVVGVARSPPSDARTTMASKKTGVGSERTKPDRQSIKGRAGAKRLGTRGPAPGYGGRPRKGDEGKTLMAKKPWEAEGVSMATWYRRKKEQKQ